MHACGIWGYFDSSAYQPCNTDTKWKRSVWEKTDKNTCYLLSERLTNSTYLRLQKLDSVAKLWEVLEYESRQILGVLCDALSLHTASSQEKMISVQ
jgi:hypothetical protein